MFQRCFSAFCLSSYWVTFNKLIWRDKKRGPIPPQELWSSGKQTNKQKKTVSKVVSFCLGFDIELNWNFEYVTETLLILKMRHHMQSPVILPVMKNLSRLSPVFLTWLNEKNLWISCTFWDSPRGDAKQFVDYP